MTKNWDLFPRAQPVGEDLANFSAYQIYQKFAVAGYGVLTGCVVSRTASDEIEITSGTYANNSAPRNFEHIHISSIAAAASDKQRYDLVYIDGADDTAKICSGVEDTPDSAIDFLENYSPRPAEPTDTDWIPLAIIRVTEDGIEASNFGTNVYATGSVANLRMAAPITVDDVTLQVVNGILSIKEGASAVKLDDLAAPDDNTDLNATTSVHGLLRKLSNSSNQFLDGQGNWSVPDHANISTIGTNSHSTIDSFISSKAAASGLASLNSSSKVVQDPANATATPTASKIVQADGTGKIATGWVPDLSATYATAAKGVTNGDSHDHNGGDGAAIAYANVSGTPTQGNSNGNVVIRPATNKIGADEITEITSAAGVTLEQTLAKDGYIQFTQIADPSAPAASKTILWSASDGKIYRIVNGGVKTEVGGGTSSFWTLVPGTPTRVNNTQFTITGDYSKYFTKGTILKWEKSGGGFQCAMVQSASYGSPNTTITILGNTLAASFTDMKYCIHRAIEWVFVVPGALPGNTATTDIARTFYPECDILAFSALVRYKTAPTTTGGVWDINDDATSVFTTKPPIAASATKGTDTVCDCVLSTADTVIAADSAVTLDYDSGHATTPGADAYVTLFYMPESWRYIT